MHYICILSVCEPCSGKSRSTRLGRSRPFRTTTGLFRSKCQGGGHVTTIVPFHAHPATLEIPSDSYPVADENGAAHYEKIEIVADLENALKEKFKAPVLALEKRVIFVHGVNSETVLPDSVKSLPGVPAHVTIPIACGKIEVAK